MRQTSKVEGTKIAQAAKDLTVTSVTIRRYLQEFNIETTSDENGIKVLPDEAMEELREIRKLKEEGLTNPKVLELLEERRAKSKNSRVPVKPKESKGKTQGKDKPESSLEADSDTEPATASDKKKPPQRRSHKKVELSPDLSENIIETTPAETGTAPDSEITQEQLLPAEGRSKHSLTCQTCGKVFEHMNPRLRDCLDCYRTKRKERRRGGADRHKNVIQHPLAQQVMNKVAQQTQGPAIQPTVERTVERTIERAVYPAAQPIDKPLPQPEPSIIVAQQFKRGPVRNYRKAIEETRQVTGSLKRRLERPDLPEGERRWLEQIYAYQLILHQGWRHLADYGAATTQQGKQTE